MRRVTSRLISWALCLSAVLWAGCNTTVGNYELATETRTVSPFTVAEVSDGVELVLTVDPEQTGDVSLEVSAESNLLGAIVTSVSEDELTVGVNGSIQARLPITVVGTVNEISEAQANNGATAAIAGIDSETLAVGAEAGATLTAEGSADNVVATASEGASLICGDLKATDAQVGLNNGASAIVCASGEVTGSVTNGATLTVLCGGDSSGVTTSNGGIVN